jgi:Lon protease-like protein
MIEHSVSEALPDDLPVFPLAGVLLLPRGQLPLNIFEPRYRAMVEDSLKTHRLIGMIQPRDGNALFQTGCAGKIIGFTETDDGRYEIMLRGISRYQIAVELELAKGGYRRVRPDWSAFPHDRSPATELNIDREKLCALLHSYFDMQGMDCNWAAVDNAGDDKLMTCLAMICPFDASEKQALLEAKCCKTRADLFMTMLEMATCDARRKKSDTPRCH